MRGASDEVLDRVLGGLLGALVEEQDGFTLFDGAEGVGGVLLAVETRGGHDAVVPLGCCRVIAMPVPWNSSDSSGTYHGSNIRMLPSAVSPVSRA